MTFIGAGPNLHQPLHRLPSEAAAPPLLNRFPTLPPIGASDSYQGEVERWMIDELTITFNPLGRHPGINMVTGTISEAIKEQLEEIIQCAICHDNLSDPRVLPCSHTFCLQCMKDVASHNNSQFVCPLRDGAVIAGARIDSLPINVVVRNLVELVSKSTGKTDALE